MAIRDCGAKWPAGSSRRSRATRRGRVLAFTLVAAVFLGIAVQSDSAMAAVRFEVGDEVEVYHLREWRPAKVLATNPQGAVMAEYEFARRALQKAFPPNEVRFPCEADALCPVREWSDASRKFRIRAAAVRLTESEVTLRKLDMEEISVPISALSDPDRRFLAKLKKDAPAAGKGGTGLAAIERFAAPGRGPLDPSFDGDGGRHALTPDPVPSYMTLTQGGAGFPAADILASIGAVLPVGGEDGWVLASVECRNAGRGTPTHLVWLSLAAQKIEKTQSLPVNDQVLDYHAASHRLLTCTPSDIGAENPTAVLAVWEVLPTDDAVKSVMRWEVPVGETLVDVTWARLIDGNTVLHRVGEKRFVAWDLANKAARYQIRQEAFFSPRPALSGNRKYVAMPEDERVRLFDARSGKVVSTLPCKTGTEALAFSPDGRWLATMSSSKLRIWDLTNGETEPRQYSASAISGSHDICLNWLGNQHLISDDAMAGMVLFSLEHEAAIWSYDFSMDVAMTGGDPRDAGRSRAIVGDHLVYSAGFRQAAQSGLAVGAVKLPGDDALRATANLDPDSLMVMLPGSPIRLEVNAGEHNAQVEAALKSKIQANGWRLDPNAPCVLIAEMTRGKTQTVTYTFSGQRPDESATITPYLNNLSIKVGNAVAWQQRSSSGSPGLVALRGDQTAQDEVDKWQKPNPGFFEKVDIPDRIFDPKKRGGLGTSKVTNRGLVSKGDDGDFPDMPSLPMGRPQRPPQRPPRPGR